MEMNDLIQLIQTVCETKMTKFELKDGEFKLSMTLGPRETQRPAQEEEKRTDRSLRKTDGACSSRRLSLRG